MDIYELYSQALEQHKAKNYYKALKILDEIKNLAPDYKKAYMLESLIWQAVQNPLNEASCLRVLLTKLDFSSTEERDYIVHVLKRLGIIAFLVGLGKQGIESVRLASKLMEKPPQNDFIKSVNAVKNSSENFSRFIYENYEKYLEGIVPYPKKFYEHDRIRVGFLSGDFGNHPVVVQSWSLLTKLDKTRFKIFHYSNVKNPDKTTEELKKTSDGWRDIYELTDEEAAKLIHDDEIDILFDLSGHTEGNRLRVAAYRPASVQMSGIGYMGSTGMECFDYFLSDIYCAGDESFFTEKLIKLPHSHFCHEPSTELASATFPPCLKNNFITFGCFNRYYKMSDDILTAWKKILDAVPKSKLILKHVDFTEDNRKSFINARLESFGFDTSRIEMRGSTENYLADYADVDIALDTFPYTGGVTTCEALYMGVPVISLYGNRHGSRFGLSILKNVGLDELAVDSYDEYIKRAIMLASDWELLAILRKNLRTMMKKSPLMDSKNYLREIQEAFIEILNEQKNLWR